jgi:hypothetical protein
MMTAWYFHRSLAYERSFFGHFYVVYFYGQYFYRAPINKSTDVLNHILKKITSICTKSEDERKENIFLNLNLKM